jgi:hypothetical protein
MGGPQVTPARGLLRIMSVISGSLGGSAAGGKVGYSSEQQGPEPVGQGAG